MISLIESPARREQFGKAAKQCVRENYSREKFADDISAAYYNVMGQAI
jgi:hypothetical protein